MLFWRSVQVRSGSQGDFKQSHLSFRTCVAQMTSQVEFGINSDPFLKQLLYLNAKIFIQADIIFKSYIKEIVVILKCRVIQVDTW